MVSLSVPGAGLVSGDVLGWLLCGFAQAASGAMVAASAAAARTTPLFMGGAYPIRRFQNEYHAAHSELSRAARPRTRSLLSVDRRNRAMRSTIRFPRR